MPRRKKNAVGRGKRNQERGNQDERGEFSGSDQIEEHDDGIFHVRRLTGSSSVKSYRCPGCDQLIPKATPHVVAWLEHDAETRRHWHTPCWSARRRRAPKVERSRNAPKF